MAGTRCSEVERQELARVQRRSAMRDSLSKDADALGASKAHRPALMGTRHMAVAGHYAAAHAAFVVLEAGGNAIDAGVAGGIALEVLQPDIVSAAGVAPIMLYHAASGQITTISGIGWGPKAADPEDFPLRDRWRRAGRAAGLAAARDAFYSGDIAATIAAFHRENDGWLTLEDMNDFHVAIEPALRTRFANWEVYTCGPWCQGPALIQALNLLDPAELTTLGHNSVDYVHVVVEAIKLAFADRERWYGDPRFVDVPIERLISTEYAAPRRGLIRPGR